MANNIVQHRRGTTADWLELDLVPYEGELVIEECTDGTCRCKIGNGISKFSELSYLSDPSNFAALSLLTEQHQKDIDIINHNLARLKDDLTTDLELLELNTETKINVLFVDELRSKLTTLISDVEQLETTVGTIETDSVGKFKKLEEDLTKLNNIVLRLPVDSSINTRIENASQSVLTQVDDRIRTEKRNYKAETDRIHAEIEKDINDLSTTLTTLRSSLSGQLTGIQDNLGLLDTKFNNVILKLNFEKDTIEGNLDDLEGRLLFKIQDVYSKINEKYSSRITDLQRLSEELETKIEKVFALLPEDLKNFKHSVSCRFDTVEADILKLRELSESAMNKIAQIRSENNAWQLLFKDSIDDTSIKELFSNHVLMEQDFSQLKEKSEKFLYTAEDGKLCTGEDLVEAVVLDCGTA